MENALRAKPEDVRVQNEREIRKLREASGEVMSELPARNKLDALAAPSKAIIEQEPSSGYRMVAGL